MAHGEIVPKEVKEAVRKPLGRIYSQKAVLIMLKRSGINAKRIIAVGDATGAFLISERVTPWIWIYDGKECRKSVNYTLPIPTHIVGNPKGKITLMLRSAIDDVLKSRKNARIFVHGEEDMAALYAIARAKGKVILYGQPKKGIVVVNVDAKEQKKAESLLCMLR